VFAVLGRLDLRQARLETGHGFGKDFFLLARTFVPLTLRARLGARRSAQRHTLTAVQVTVFVAQLAGTFKVTAQRGFAVVLDVAAAAGVKQRQLGRGQ
jgi:hypothetical protein